MEQSTVLSVSSTNPLFNCKNVANKLKECGVQCKITQNNSIVEKRKKLFHEIGCTVELFNFDNTNLKNQVWKPIKDKYRFNCAHLFITNEYSGCIHGYFQDGTQVPCENK
tara:strand:- start:3239 stop:3568 length:330 start_codon:yes stop_codon:yes gene_type:complete